MSAIPQFHVVAMEVLAEMGRAADPAPVTRGLPNYVGEIEQLEGVERLQISWAIIGFRNQYNQIFIFAHGVYGPGSSLDLMTGYGGNMETVRRDNQGFNHVMRNDAITAINRVVQPLYRSGATFQLFGHSGGGAVVEVMGKILNDRNPGKVTDIVTYAAPMAGLSGSYLELPTVNRFRYMCFGDPVPGIPNCAQANGAMAVVLQPGNRNTLPAYAHGSGGIGVSNGSHSVRQGPWVEDNLALSINRWIQNQEPETRLHRANNYALVMRTCRNNDLIRERPDARPERAGVSDPPQLLEQVVLPLDFEGAPPLNPINRLIVLPIDIPLDAQVVLPVAITLDRGGRVVTPISSDERERRQRRSVMASAFMSPTIGWKFVRASRFVYNIMWMNQLMATATSRSRARTICRMANRLLRSMSSPTQWSQQAILSAWSIWLVTASSGDKGYEPPLLLSQ